MIGDAIATQTTHLHGYEVTLSQEPGSSPMCDVAIQSNGFTYSGSLTRLETLDGCLEAGVGQLWTPSVRAVDLIGNWARANGY